MTKHEAREANTIHAIWDIIVMHHSVNSAVADHQVTLADIENIMYRLKEKCNEARYQSA